jgi:hypothetical protein
MEHILVPRQALVPEIQEDREELMEPGILIITNVAVLVVQEEVRVVVEVVHLPVPGVAGVELVAPTAVMYLVVMKMDVLPVMAVMEPAVPVLHHRIPIPQVPSLPIFCQPMAFRALPVAVAVAAAAAAAPHLEHAVQHVARFGCPMAEVVVMAAAVVREVMAAAVRVVVFAYMLIVVQEQLLIVPLIRVLRLVLVRVARGRQELREVGAPLVPILKGAMVIKARVVMGVLVAMGVMVPMASRAH